MSIAKVIEINAASAEGIEDAIYNGITKVNRTVEDVRGAWLKDLSVCVENGKITEYRVAMKVTFVLKE